MGEDIVRSPYEGTVRHSPGREARGMDKKIEEKSKEIKRYNVRKIGLFGSFAKNEQHKKSDIDILIDFFPEKENYDNYMAVYDIFEGLFGNERIEIVTKNGLSPYIGPSILKEVMYV